MSDLVEIWRDTCKYFSGRKIQKGEKIKISRIDFPPENMEKDPCKIEILDEDTFNLAIKYRQEGLHPLVLNMASDFKAGGGVRTGKMAQEEELFRRSSAFMSHQEEWYPLKMNEAIYCPEVIIVKDDRYQFIHEVVISLFTISALRRPKLIDGKYSEASEKIMRQKIESIFQQGIKMKHDSLVLGAFGCGAFQNPPEQVAMIFFEMVKKYRFYFKKIGFAILVVKSKDKFNLAAFEKANKNL